VVIFGVNCGMCGMTFLYWSRKKGYDFSAKDGRSDKMVGCFVAALKITVMTATSTKV